ncbi:MAG TPA: hypothetical protein VLI90_01095 [Tepidisphaeraceae bacterium]|nr:hypothetical protein [Tepidisphaeraceae bacterium]
MRKRELNTYRRLLPGAILVVSLGLSALYAHRAAGKGDGSLLDDDKISLAQLEQKIADSNAPPAVWMSYGRRLYDAKEYSRAALAYAHVMEAEPFNRDARFQRALALAGAGDAEGLLGYLRDQLYTDPKLPAEALGRSELRQFLNDPRFAALQKDAAAQAMD